MSSKKKAPATIKRFGELAPRLEDQGYRALPLFYGKKNPSVLREWQHYRFKPQDVAGRLSYKMHGTGILCGEVVALDIDVRDTKLASELEALAEKDLGTAPRRIGAAPKVLRIYRTDAPFAKITSKEVALPGDAAGAKKHKVEVLGVGQQFVAFNQHPDTGKPYVWNGAGDPLTIPAADLVTVTETQMREFVTKCNEILSKHAKPARDAPGELIEGLHQDAEDQAAQLRGTAKNLEATNPDECRSALKAIPNADLDYDNYIRIGHAIAGAFGAAGEDNWHEWASQSAKYDQAKSASDWAGFMKQGEAGTLKSGAGTIYREAKAAGWHRPAPTRESLIQTIPADWLSTPPPPQEWLVDNLIPMGCVTAVLSEGGMGKSFATLTLAEGTAHGSKRWWSAADERSLRRGGVVYVAAEDTLDVIRRRLFAVRTRWISRMSKTLTGKALADAIEARDTETRKHLHLAPIVGMDIHLIDTTTGEVKQGPGVDRLIENLQQVDDLVLVVLDPLARLHGGDENSNSVSTALINAAERIAQEFGCAVLVLHHVSKQAASDKSASAHSGRGGSALGDGARSVLRFLPVDAKDFAGLKLLRLGVPITQSDIDDNNVVRIVHAKNSYGPRQKDIYLLRDKETGELLTLKVVADTRDPYAVRMAALKKWLTDNAVTITKDTFRDATELRKKVFGTLSKNDWLEHFDTAVVKGELVEDSNYHGKNSDAKGYRLADTRHTRQIPASGSAGIAEEGEGSAAGGIPAAGPPPIVAGIFQRVSGKTKNQQKRPEKWA